MVNYLFSNIDTVIFVLVQFILLVCFRTLYTTTLRHIQTVSHICFIFKTSRHSNVYIIGIWICLICLDLDLDLFNALYH